MEYLAYTEKRRVQFMLQKLTLAKIISKEPIGALHLREERKGELKANAEICWLDRKVWKSHRIIYRVVIDAKVASIVEKRVENKAKRPYEKMCASKVGEERVNEKGTGALTHLSG